MALIEKEQPSASRAPVPGKFSARGEMIRFSGVKTHNLQNIDVSLPLGQITVVTGVSGSGKSSLVFDTVYAESYRRYVESLSSFARQYMKSLPRPSVQAVENLLPSVAVRQARSGATSRSTVGTATELADLMRIIFTHCAQIFCRACGKPVRKETPESVCDLLSSEHAGVRVLVTAPLSAWGRMKVKDLKTQLEMQGFTRIVGGLAGEARAVLRLEDARAADLKDGAVVIDRVPAGAEQADRMREALRLAFRVGRGRILVLADDLSWSRSASQDLECAACNIPYSEPSMALFSHNNPRGACPDCQGFGYTAAVDWDKAVPDRSKRLADKAVKPWNFGKFVAYYRWAKSSAQKLGIDTDKPFADYTPEEWRWLQHGDGKDFDGIQGFFDYLETKKYKVHYRIHAARFRRYELCQTCEGARLCADALACRAGGLNLGQVGSLSIAEIVSWLEKVRAERAADGGGSRSDVPDDGLGVDEAFAETAARLSYLCRIGVGYLSLARPSRTLSGGELQRINMARCLGSALTETLFCLDEPTVGLHPRDSQALLGIMRELRDQGNTVLVVEHDQCLIDGADHLIHVGPGAGHQGGKIVYAGTPGGQDQHTPPRQPARRRIMKEFLELRGAGTNNLKNISVRFPVGAVTAVCGVSGSGKTSLVQHTLFPVMAKSLGQEFERAGDRDPVAQGIGPATVLRKFSSVMLVSQSALGRSSRSNIATKLGNMDDIRKVFAAEPLASKLGLGPGAFSFNTAGGRCENCKGLGMVTEDLSFLGEMEVICHVCEGRRFGDGVLSVKVRGRNLNEILTLTVSEAMQVFYDVPGVRQTLGHVEAMGLGYMTLGQATSSFSGGEAQRLKLAELMRGVDKGKPSLLIFDEPSSGLSDADVANLLEQFRALADAGHTLVIVEHHPRVLRFADWLIEIGPEAARAGGELVYEGPPDGIGSVARSVTAPYLTVFDRGADGVH